MVDTIKAGSLFFAIITPIIGIRSILVKDFRPHRTTRLVILILSSVFFVTLLINKEFGSIYLSSVQLFGSVTIFLLSLKKGVGGATRFDKFVLSLCVILIFCLFNISDLVVTLILTIAVDIIAFLPTILKIVRNPESEEWKFYFADVLASTLTLLSFDSFSISSIIFPLYLFSLNLFMVLMIRRKSFTVHWFQL